MTRVLRGAAVVAALVALVLVRVGWSSREAWLEGEARRAAGDEAGALDAYGRAARLYAPGNPWSAGALDRLAASATAHEAAGEAAPALSAWREVRSSILATRSSYTPHPSLLATANEHIAALAAATEPESADPGATLDARRRWHAARLAHDDAPSVPFTLLALAGLALWLGAAVGFILRGVDDDDRLRPRPALASAAVLLAGAALFTLGLACA